MLQSMNATTALNYAHVRMILEKPGRNPPGIDLQPGMTIWLVNGDMRSFTFPTGGDLNRWVREIHDEWTRLQIPFCVISPLSISLLDQVQSIDWAAGRRDSGDLIVTYCNQTARLQTPVSRTVFDGLWNELKRAGYLR